MSTVPATVWAVLPAAGVGRRMQSPTPKQYLDLLGRPVIHWSLETLLDSPRVAGAVVALGDGDPHWSTLAAPASGKPVFTVVGGRERFESVFNALCFLLERETADCRVLVHDAVRPCVASRDVERLLDRGLAAPEGALLAVPVRDTLKRQGADGSVAGTAERAGLWHALTPQLFPLGSLHAALKAVIAGNLAVTDEAQAMECAGYRPLLVEGSATNLKITRPEDLSLAAAILRARA